MRKKNAIYCGRRKQFYFGKWNAFLKTGRNESTYERLIYTLSKHNKLYLR